MIRASFFRSDVTKCLVSLAVPALIMLTPCDAVYTTSMRSFLAVTALGMLLMAFELFDDLVPAIVIPSGYLLSGICSVQQLLAGWSNTLIYMIVGTFVLSSIMDEKNFLRRIAYWAILKTGDNFTSLLWGLFGACCLMTLISFGNAFPVIGTMAYGLCRALNLKRGRASAAIVLVCCLGGVSVRSWIYSPLLIGLLQPLASQVLGADFHVRWYHEMGYNLTYFLVVLSMVWYVIKAYRPEQPFKGRDYFLEEYRRLGPMTSDEKKIGVVVCLIMLFLLTSPLHEIDCNWAFIVLPWTLFLPGIEVGTMKSLKNINWSMICFIFACFLIGLVASSLGFGKLISSHFTPVMKDLGFFSSTILVYLSTAALNFFLTPYAIMSAIVVPFMQIALDMDINPMTWLMAIIQGIDQIAFPYEYPAYLCIFGFGMCRMSDFIKVYTLKMVVGILFFSLLTIPSWVLVDVMFTKSQ